MVSSVWIFSQSSSFVLELSDVSNYIFYYKCTLVTYFVDSVPHFGSVGGKDDPS